ncbi:MAG: DUF2244 domain-containing protein [Caulobacterales bacterium]
MDAVLRPNRSLSPRGFNRIMLGLGTLSFGVGLVFLLHGAWPVMGFFGLEVLVVWIAFRVSYKQGKLVERVRVPPALIHIERVAPNGQARYWAVNPIWARVEHEKKGPNADAVRLIGGDGRVALGRFLAPEERVSFASALRTAIFKAKRNCAELD